MPVLKDIAAIAKGMSITFGEMFKPTVVENYPDGPGPLKGAKFQSVIVESTSCNATKTVWKNASPVSCVPQLALRIASISKPPKTPKRSA